MQRRMIKIICVLIFLCGISVLSSKDIYCDELDNVEIDSDIVSGNDTKVYEMAGNYEVQEEPNDVDYKAVSETVEVMEDEKEAVVEEETVIKKDVIIEKLKVNITTTNGESVLIKNGSTYYTAYPVRLGIQRGKGDKCYYSLSTDYGKSFGGYVEMNEDNIVLYPDENMVKSNHFVLRLKKVTDGNEDIEYISDDYNIEFDYLAPQIEIVNAKDCAMWTNEVNNLDVILNDDKGYLGRVVVINEGNIIYEERFKGEDCVRNTRISLPLEMQASNSYGSKIEIYAYDLAQNCSVSEYRYYYDNEAPIIVCDGIDDNQILTGDSNIKIHVRDLIPETVGVHYTLVRSIGGEAVISELDASCDGNREIVIPINEEGDYELSTYAYDFAGNRSEDRYIRFGLDKSAPNIAISGITDNLDVKDEVDVQINVSKIMYDDCNVKVNVLRKRPGEVKTVADVSYAMEAQSDIRSMSFKNDGDYTVLVKAIDKAGRCSEEMTNFRIDKSAPKLAISGVNEGEVTNTIPTLRINVSDVFYDATLVSTQLLQRQKNGEYAVIKQDNYVPKEQNSSYDLGIKEEGIYKLLCAAADRTGNVTQRQVDFTVDYTPPVIADLSKYDGKYLDSFVLPKSIRSMISDMSSYDYECLINDKAMHDGDTILEEGKYTLWIGAVDAASNGSDKEATFVIDHTAPQIVIGGVSKDGNIKKGNILSVSLSDDEDMLEQVIFNGREIAISDNGKRADIMVDDYGDYALEIKASDMAGNEIDKVINTSCVMAGAALLDYMKVEEIVSDNIVPDSQGTSDFNGMVLGVITMLIGTFGLVYRGVYYN